MNAAVEGKTGGNGAAESRRQWCYVSGRISCLETMLLSRAIFHAIMDAHSIVEAKSTLAKTNYRSVFTSDTAVANYAETIATYATTVREALFKESPAHAVEEFSKLPKRYRTIRGLFVRKAGAATGGESAETLAALASTEAESRALAGHVELARGRRYADDPVARSLFLDSAAVTAGLALAGGMEEEPVGRFCREKMTLAAWASVLRSAWNGTPAETIEEWFVIGGDGELVKRTARSAETDPAAGIAGEVSLAVEHRLRQAGPRAIRDDVDAATAEALREEVLELKMTAFGPERLLAYLEALHVEEVNLRIALAAAEFDMDRKAALARLRKEYV